MYTLGIGDVTHDKSVCLVKNNRVVCVVEEERLTRIKHGIKLNPYKYTILEFGKYFNEILAATSTEGREKSYDTLIKHCMTSEGINYNDIECTVVSSLNSSLPFRHSSVYLHHHVAHCASAFYPSSFDKAAILVVDGYGVYTDGRSESVMYAFGNKNKITVIDTINGYCDYTKEELEQGLSNAHMVFKNSLGVFYQNITILLELGYLCEGKTMGLASYGKPNDKLNKIREFVEFLPDGQLNIDNRSIFLFCVNYISEAKKILDNDKLFQLYADLAYIHQELLEKMLFHLCNHLYKQTNCESLCIAGGVSLNSVANGKILANTPFKDIFIQPAAGDNGISIGCALYGTHALLNNSRKYYKNKRFSPFLGKDYTSEEINQAIYEFKDKIIDKGKVIKATKLAAKYISEGKIVGWFNGKSEIGPRALGNRSIFVDPRDPNMKNYLNQKVKHRESFRPFAPITMEEKASKYFETERPVPYMLEVVPVKENKRKVIPSVTHIDGSARLQTVSKKDNPICYDLIKNFEELTNVPVLLNTSFNDNGEPIVETPSDAIRCFLRTEIDILFVNGRLLLKK